MMTLRTLSALTSPIGSNDARLLALAETMRVAMADYDAICAAADRADDHAAADDDALGAAWARYEAATLEAASIPADGLPGLAVKAARVLRGIDEGPADADWELARSLVADIARLCPEARASA
jgi:hypothetical protein